MPDNLGTQLSHTTPSSVLQFFSSAAHSLVSILPAPQIYSSSTHSGFTCQSTSCLSFLSLIIRLVIDSLSPPLTLLPSLSPNTWPRQPPCLNRAAGYSIICQQRAKLEGWWRTGGEATVSVTKSRPGVIMYPLISFWFGVRVEKAGATSISTTRGNAVSLGYITLFKVPFQWSGVIVSRYVPCCAMSSYANNSSLVY